MKSSSFLWIAGAMGLLSLLSFGALLLYKPSEPPLPVMGTAPSFDLIDQDGKAFSSESLVGKVWVADFFFVNCPGPCPKMSAHMRQVNEAFAGNPDVVLVSITVDPENDTPTMLKRYGKRLEATESWHFLTGEADVLHDLAVSGFKIGNPDALILHSTKFVLVDRSGQVRGYFEGTDPDDIKVLSGAIRRLL